MTLSNTTSEQISCTSIKSFPPIAAPNARVLILGSIPGGVSLQQMKYYAHPRNAFWPIMAALNRFDTELDYDSRVSCIKAKGLAVWDVMRSCDRPGSLDSKIYEKSIRCNDFMAFFEEHPCITHVFFNGAKAAESYRRYVKHAHPVLTQRLPSTSPANASMEFKDKLSAWRAVGEALKNREI